MVATDVVKSVYKHAFILKKVLFLYCTVQTGREPVKERQTEREKETERDRERKLKGCRL